MKESKGKPLEASLECDPTPDSEERLNEIFELLLSKESRCSKNDS